MIIDVCKEKVFIPEWNGNKELPDDEQIKVTHRFLKPGEKKKYLYVEPIEYIYQSDGKVDQRKTRFVQDEKNLALALVTKIENYALRIDGKIVQIDSMQKLYDTPSASSKLSAEIEEYLLNCEPDIDTDPL